MIDLHSHILPALDDGAPDYDASLAMARVAVADGVRTIVATPHVNSEYQFDIADIGLRCGELNIRLARARVPLAVLAGAEIAMPRIRELPDETLRDLCLGSGPALLIESPYVRAAGFMEDLLFDLQVRGFKPVLGHPERCPIFQRDIELLRSLAQRGVLCSVNAGSMAGAFGSTVRRFALQLFREGLVHDVSSDAHDDRRRAPVLTPGFERAEPDLPGVSAQRAWFTEEAPAAILGGEPLPERPPSLQPPPSPWRRAARRLRARHDPG